MGWDRRSGPTAGAARLDVLSQCHAGRRRAARPAPELELELTGPSPFPPQAPDGAVAQLVTAVQQALGR